MLPAAHIGCEHPRPCGADDIPNPLQVFVGKKPTILCVHSDGLDSSESCPIHEAEYHLRIRPDPSALAARTVGSCVVWSKISYSRKGRTAKGVPFSLSETQKTKMRQILPEQATPTIPVCHSTYHSPVTRSSTVLVLCRIIQLNPQPTPKYRVQEKCARTLRLPLTVRRGLFLFFSCLTRGLSPR